jgi:ornithine carbamoyltransferase
VSARPGSGPQRFLEVDDLTSAQLDAVLDRAASWKADPTGVPSGALAGTGIAALFQKPSLRTRVSFEMAVATLGGHPVSLREGEVSLGARESASDVARTLAGYCCAIAARVFDHAVLEAMQAAVSVPVINLLSDQAHPCQALADLMTLRESWGELEGRRVAFVGDGNNVAASLAIGAALTGLEVVLASPPGFELPEETVARARHLGGVIELTTDPAEAVRDAHAVYTDVWTSMGQEAEADHRTAIFAPYRVDAELMSHAEPGALFLHCLPAHRGDEVTDEVIDGPASVVWAQAENRMHAARALLVELVASPLDRSATRA